MMRNESNEKGKCTGYITINTFAFGEVDTDAEVRVQIWKVLKFEYCPYFHDPSQWYCGSYVKDL